MPLGPRSIKVVVGLFGVLLLRLTLALLRLKGEYYNKVWLVCDTVLEYVSERVRTLRQQKNDISFNPGAQIIEISQYAWLREGFQLTEVADRPSS